MNVAERNIPNGQKQSSPIVTAILLLLALALNLPFFQMERASAQAGSNVTTDKSVKPAETPVAESAKIPGDLSAIINTSANKDVRQDVIVQFFGKLSVKHTNTIKKAGGTIKTRLEGINSILVSIPVSNLNNLAEDSQVVIITPDREMKASLDTANLLFGKDHFQTSAQGVHRNYTN